MRAGRQPENECEVKKERDLSVTKTESLAPRPMGRQLEYVAPLVLDAHAVVDPIVRRVRSRRFSTPQLSVTWNRPDGTTVQALVRLEMRGNTGTVHLSYDIEHGDLTGLQTQSIDVTRGRMQWAWVCPKTHEHRRYMVLPMGARFFASHDAFNLRDRTGFSALPPAAQAALAAQQAGNIITTLGQPLQAFPPRMREKQAEAIKARIARLIRMAHAGAVTTLDVSPARKRASLKQVMRAHTRAGAA